VDSKALAVMATAVAGGLVAMQAPINSGLGKAVGSLPAASFSFAIGLVALVGITFMSGEGFGQIGELGGLSWYYLIGGLLGAVYVTTVLISVRTLGAGGVTAATIAGQLSMSLVVDQFGLFGVAKQPITAARVLGVLLLAAGVYLVVRD
jgi:bacterial/archaeal transporter family-2 protein